MQTSSPPWASPAESVLQELGTSGGGLTEGEAADRLRSAGENLLAPVRRTDRWTILLRQFVSPVVLTLAAAAILAVLVGDPVDAIAIAAILLLNGFIGYFQEAKAEEAVAALKRLAAPRARVLRGGTVWEIPASQVCPGDLLVLESGDLVAADARLLSANQLAVGEAALTGESLPVEKETEPCPEDAALADRSCMVWGGTVVASGSARAVVIATGMSTEMGRIAGLLAETAPGPTPLQVRLGRITNRLIVACIAVVLIVAGLGLLHGYGRLEILLSSVSLAVAAIPEGLPTVVTLALALAVRRMVRRNAIVRHLPSVETLGSTTVICTDKTGTLTTGRMAVREVWVDGEAVEVEHAGRNESARRLVGTAALCTNASLGKDGEGTGDPTEVAILRLAAELGLQAKGRRIAEWAFDSVRKRMSVAVAEDGGARLCVKGAAEAMLPRCAMDEEKRRWTAEAAEALAAEGRRVLAVAERSLSREPDPRDPADAVEREMAFLGLLAFADPPRPEARDAVRRCKEAGIRVVMITGDHPLTARAVAEELGLIEPGLFEGVATGPELVRMADLTDRVEGIAVYARVSPEHKLSIVRAWKKRGHVVAMTGDGVNDAPALREASIGAAMGRGGTEVARQASSMVLTDDNFATIVAAIEEGRAIYGNIRRTIRYLLSGNLSEIMVMLTAAVAGWPIPLAAVHLLWINLVTDGMPALALAAEPVPRKGLGEMRRPSADLGWAFYRGILGIGLLGGVLSIAVYGWFLASVDHATARSHTFTFVVLEQLFRSFAARSERRTFWELGAGSNLHHLFAIAIPLGFQIALLNTSLLAEVFKVRPMGWTDLAWTTALALAPVTVLEVAKLVRAGRAGAA